MWKINAPIALDNYSTLLKIHRCYECGEPGHLSYSCPTNLLGDREPPKKKPRIRKHKNSQQPDENSELLDDSDSQDENENNYENESLSEAIRYQVRNLIVS